MDQMINAQRTSAMDLMGTNVVGAQTAEEALKEAGAFGWNVQKVPMYADLREYPGSPHAAYHDPKTFKTVGMINGEVTPLGTVGDQYKVIQNEEHAGFLNEVVGQSKGHFKQVAPLRGGRLMYVAIELPEAVQVQGVDPVNVLLYGVNSHDGTTHFMLTLSPERLACANQLSYFRHNAIKFRHSGNIKDKVMDAQRALGITFDLMKEFEAEANRLATVDMRLGQYMDVVNELHPKPEGYGEPSMKRTTNKYDRLIEGLEEAYASPANANINGTAWGGLQAYIEYAEWMNGSDKGRGERIMAGADLERKISKAKDRFEAYALTA